MDAVIQVELLLNMLNSALTKAMYFKDDFLIKQLSDMQHSIYYDSFNVDVFLQKLKEIDIELKKYD